MSSKLWKRGADAAMGWRSAPPLRRYQSDPETAGANWVLEVGQVSLLRLSDGSMLIEIQALGEMKMIVSETRREESVIAPEDPTVPIRERSSAMA